MPAQSLASRGEAALAAAGGGTAAFSATGAASAAGQYEKTVVGVPAGDAAAPKFEKTVVGVPGGASPGYDPPPAPAEGTFEKTAAFTKPEGGNGPGA